MTLSGAAKLAGVIGWPIAHSRSPAIHGYWLEQYQIDGAYVPLGIDPNNIDQMFDALPKLGFRGWNVTLPHKESAFRLVHERTQTATEIGAVNTVTVQPDGSLHGIIRTRLDLWRIWISQRRAGLKTGRRLCWVLAELPALSAADCCRPGFPQYAC